VKYLWGSLGLVGEFIAASAVLSAYLGYVVAKARGISPVVGTIVGLVLGPLGIAIIGLTSVIRSTLGRTTQVQEDYV
jgi:F0F1-type ATP synthase assembly protein I